LLTDITKNEFYICDVFDSFKDDMASMEHPIFSLSKTPDHRMLVYERGGIIIKIKPSYTGLATILDKDVLLYLASLLMNAKNRGEKISKTIRFTTYDYLLSTNKSIGGFQYQQLQEGLERLSGTRIQTNIKTTGTEIIKDFGLIDSWEMVKKDKKGKLEAIEVTLSEWFFNSILGNEVLSIDKDYFKLGKPTEKRLYELARKHCGNQVVWKIKLESLKLKLGITSQLKILRFNIKKIAETNHLPEYNITLENDVVIFTRKYPPKEPTKTASLPLHVTKSDISKVANPGESEQQASERIKKLAEQKGVSTKSIVTSIVADKEAKRKPITTTGSKPVSAKDSSKIKNLRKAINRNTKEG
jgi:plasmid replication initiation protein